MREAINDIKQKEMDRKEFLRFVGAGILLVTGVAGFIKSLKSFPSSHLSSISSNSGYGYGRSPYGKNNKPGV